MEEVGSDTQKQPNDQTMNGDIPASMLADILEVTYDPWACPWEYADPEPILMLGETLSVCNRRPGQFAPKFEVIIKARTFFERMQMDMAERIENDRLEKEAKALSVKRRLELTPVKKTYPKKAKVAPTYSTIKPLNWTPEERRNLYAWRKDFGGQGASRESWRTAGRTPKEPGIFEGI